VSNGERLHKDLKTRLEPLNGETTKLLKDFGLLRILVYRMALSIVTQDIRLADEEVDSFKVKYLKANRISSEDELRNHLDSIGMDDLGLVDQLCLSTKVARFAKATFETKSEAHFLKRKEDLDVASCSLIRVSDENLAFELFLRIEEDPHSFESVARTFGEGPERLQAGKITGQNLSGMEPALANLLRRSRPGQVSEPIQIQNWWILVKLEELRLARLNDEMRQRMCQELFEEWLNREIDTIIQSI
jgi:parvulin-like peptidyl-prolyl isomerase